MRLPFTYTIYRKLQIYDILLLFHLLLSPLTNYFLPFSYSVFLPLRFVLCGLNLSATIISVQWIHRKGSFYSLIGFFGIMKAHAVVISANYAAC